MSMDLLLEFRVRSISPESFLTIIPLSEKVCSIHDPAT